MASEKHLKNILADEKDFGTEIQLHNVSENADYSVEFKKRPPEDIEPNPHLLYTQYVKSKSLLCWLFLKSLKIEVIMFVYMFAYVVRSVTSTTMIMRKVCITHLELPLEICDNLPDHKDWKVKVETMANNYHAGHSLIQMLPSAILACFIGPWSDIYGRKAPIILALLGIIIDGLGSIICAYYIHSRVEYYFIPAIFTGLSGGFISVLTIVYSYASDMTSTGSRTIKYALLEVAFSLSMPLGAVAGGMVFDRFGYVPVFITSVAGHVFGLAWVLFVLQETRGIGNKDSWKVKIRNLFSIDAFMDSFRATIKRRPHQGRKQLWLLMLGMSIIILTFASASSIAYLYVYHRYNWGNSKYSTVSAVFTVMSMVILMVTVPLMTKVLKLGDASLGILGTSSLLIKNLTISLAERQGVYYLGNLLGLLSGTASLGGRSRISKIISKNDIGKVFAFLSTAESLLPVFATVAFSQIFNYSLNFFPGLSYMVTAVLLLVSLGIYIWLAFIPDVIYEEVEEEKQPSKELEEQKTSEKS